MSDLKKVDVVRFIDGVRTVVGYAYVDIQEGGMISIDACITNQATLSVLKPNDLHVSLTPRA